MIKPWLILTKNWFRSRIGWNVTKWSRCLHIEQFCISQLLVGNRKSSTCIWLQLIDYISNEIIGVIGDWISRIGCFLVAHCSIKFHFKYWNILQCHLITVTFFGYKIASDWIPFLAKSNPNRSPNQCLKRYLFRNRLCITQKAFWIVVQPVTQFFNRSWKQIFE